MAEAKCIISPSDSLYLHQVCAAKETSPKEADVMNAKSQHVTRPLKCHWPRKQTRLFDRAVPKRILLQGGSQIAPAYQSHFNSQAEQLKRHRLRKMSADRKKVGHVVATYKALD